MAKNEEKGVKKMSRWDKICAWYASHGVAVGMIYSIGASVVIIGALFKILHWPGASIVLMIGMFTEAFLFIIGIFEKPHPTYHWENVYPELIHEEGGAEEEHKQLEAGKPVHAVESAHAESASFNGLEDGDVKALKESIKSMAATAGTLADLSKLADGSNKLSEKLSAAAEATDKFVGAQSGVAEAAGKLGSNYEAAAKLSETLRADTEAAAKSQAAAAKNLAALNAAYELNLKAVQNNVAEAEKMAAANEAAAKAGEAFVAAQEKLAKQVADLNKVYGNMLSALA